MTPARQAGPSVVLLRGEPLVPETRGPALLRALQDCEAELNQGAIVTLDWSDKPRAINAVHLMMFRWGRRSFCVVCQRSPKAADHEVRWSAPLHSLRHIPVRRLHPKSRLRQPLADGVGDHHRTMMSACAAERNRQVALAFADVMRHQVN